jgi:hypothetical protein
LDFIFHRGNKVTWLLPFFGTCFTWIGENHVLLPVYINRSGIVLNRKVGLDSSVPAAVRRDTLFLDGNLWSKSPIALDWVPQNERIEIGLGNSLDNSLTLRVDDSYGDAPRSRHMS